MYVIGMAEEFKKYKIAVNALWPKYVIATDSLKAVNTEKYNVTSDRCRKPEIMADATLKLTQKNSETFTGNHLLDEEFLKSEGILNFDQYAVNQSIF